MTGGLSTTIWLSNRHGRAFWRNTRSLYTPQFAALIDSDMNGRGNGVAVGFLSLTRDGLDNEATAD